ncbi:unnamed protein product [Candidula unifasciata]|uniref:F-box domain-containing protein n=1 Tax=Candidula unifasciata TaxID=100452 RepID=A0A8S3YHB1_9EUPU|nr:unnamed protein product [Candidula unifasciata]
MASKWERRCKPWLNEDGSLYSRTDVAPAPSKDFLQLFVTANEVIFRVWKIIPPTRADAVQQPSQTVCTYSEFIDDERLRATIARNFGEHELQYLDRLVAGQIDYLCRLPRKILLRIIFNLDLVSIAKLSQTNRLFRELCSCDALWSKLYLQHTTQPITPDLLMLSDQKGWKELFFTNKLQLQMMLKRQAEKQPRDKRFAFAEKFSKGGASKGGSSKGASNH